MNRSLPSLILAAALFAVAVSVAALTATLLLSPARAHSLEAPCDFFGRELPALSGGEVGLGVGGGQVPQVWVGGGCASSGDEAVTVPVPYWSGA